MILFTTRLQCYSLHNEGEGTHTFAYPYLSLISIKRKTNRSEWILGLNLSNFDSECTSTIHPISRTCPAYTVHSPNLCFVSRSSLPFYSFNIIQLNLFSTETKLEVEHFGTLQELFGHTQKLACNARQKLLLRIPDCKWHFAVS